jgi:hypothetical protein
MRFATIWEILKKNGKMTTFGVYWTKPDKIEIDAIRIEKLEAALRKIADIEHEDLPKPVGAAEGTLWVILAGCVEVAEKALEGKENE